MISQFCDIMIEFFDGAFLNVSTELQLIKSPNFPNW